MVYDSPGVAGSYGGGPPQRRRCLAVVVLLLGGWVEPATAGGGVKLWELGEDVERHPLMVSLLFVFIFLLTMAVEALHHRAERRLVGTHRGEALKAITNELMMIGVVSFLLILVAELGFVDVRFKEPGCTPSGDGSGNGSDGSGSSDTALTNAPATYLQSSTPTGMSAATPTPDRGAGAMRFPECYFGFDILLFEYAHLVLFFMGIIYGVFIQVCFKARDAFAKTVSGMQRVVLGDAAALSGGVNLVSLFSIMGMWSPLGYQTALVTLRNAMVLRLEERMHGVCDPVQWALEDATAVVKGTPRPRRLAAPHEAAELFDFGRYVHIAMAETLLGLLHVPPAVWIGVVIMSFVNLIHLLGVPLPHVLLYFSFVPVAFSFTLLLRLAWQLRGLVARAHGHPGINTCNYLGRKSQKAFSIPSADKAVRAYGREWAAGGPDPWVELTGCFREGSWWNRFDPNDPGAIAVQIQVTVFTSCFFLGEIVMLGKMIYDAKGAAVLTLLTVIAVLPLVWLVPRVILVYTLVYKTRDPPSTWLARALVKRRDGADGGTDEGADESDDNTSEWSLPPTGKERAAADALDDLAEVLQQRQRRGAAAPARAAAPPKSPLAPSYYELPGNASGLDPLCGWLGVEDPSVSLLDAPAPAPPLSPHPLVHRNSDANMRLAASASLLTPPPLVHRASGSLNAETFPVLQPPSPRVRQMSAAASLAGGSVHMNGTRTPPPALTINVGGTAQPPPTVWEGGTVASPQDSPSPRSAQVPPSPFRQNSRMPPRAWSGVHQGVSRPRRDAGGPPLTPRSEY